MDNTRVKFQGKCFLSPNNAGHMFMSSYDAMPERARKRLMNSPFNICAACAQKEYFNHGTFDALEAAALAELGPFGPQPVNPSPLVAKPQRLRHVGRQTADLLDLPQADQG